MNEALHNQISVKPIQNGRVRAVKSGVAYFLPVLAAGWILGPIRTLWAAPRFGALAAILMEAPLMLIAMLLAAKSAIRRYAVNSVGAAIVTGAIAMGLLIPAEVAGLWFRGLTLNEYLLGLLTAPGIVSLSMFFLFAAMPTLITIARRQEQRTARDRR